MVKICLNTLNTLYAHVKFETEKHQVVRLAAAALEGLGFSLYPGNTEKETLDAGKFVGNENRN